MIDIVRNVSMQHFMFKLKVILYLVVQILIMVGFATVISLQTNLSEAIIHADRNKCIHVIQNQHLTTM